MTPLLNQPPQKREARVSRLFLGVLLLYVIASASAIGPVQGSAGYMLGRFIGLALLAAPCVWLIVSGVPKTLGLNVFQRRKRRRIWYWFLGAGLLITVALFSLFAYLGWPAAAGLVNLVFWLIWTWVSWIFADKRAV
jgi:hypothetical protein